MARSRVEYADFNITVYPTCSYGCAYCFWRVPLMRARLSRIKPRPVEEASRLAARRKPARVVVSFTTDPYPPQEVEKRLTRRVLDTLSQGPLRVFVLTKNPGLALRDLDIMLNSPRAEFWLGTTLISLERNELEPRAPPPEDRLAALKEAKSAGARVWVSLEPLIPSICDPVELVEAVIDVADWVVLGRLNYASQLGLPPPSDEDYRRVLEAINVLTERSVAYLVKRELRRTLEKLEKD